MTGLLLQGPPVFPGLGAELFLLGRLAFGGVLAFMGLNHFLQTDGMTGYAEAKGLPAPRLGVLVSGGTLVFGGLGVAFGVAPALAAGAVATFTLVSAVVFHDFWAVPDDQSQDELTQFLKNTVIFGAALGLLAVASVPWPYSLGVTLL